MNAASGCADARRELDAYLRERYVSLERIAEETGMEASRIEELVETGCMPGPSYELRIREELYAYVNGDPDAVSVRTVARYFAADAVAWVDSIAPRLSDASPKELAPTLKSELRAAFREGLIEHGGAAIGYEGFIDGTGRIDETGFDAHFEEYVWPHWRAGTWGICVYGSRHMRNVARKTVAVYRLKSLTDDGAKKEYSQDEARDIRDAMFEYDSIVPPFSPHDRHVSSRARLVEALGDRVGYPQQPPATE